MDEDPPEHHKHKRLCRSFSVQVFTYTWLGLHRGNLLEQFWKASYAEFALPFLGEDV